MAINQRHDIDDAIHAATVYRPGDCAVQTEDRMRPIWVFYIVRLNTRQAVLRQFVRDGVNGALKCLP